MLNPLFHKDVLQSIIITQRKKMFHNAVYIEIDDNLEGTDVAADFNRKKPTKNRQKHIIV